LEAEALVLDRAARITPLETADFRVRTDEL
jgi:hypothetical protein